METVVEEAVAVNNLALCENLKENVPSEVVAVSVAEEIADNTKTNGVTEIVEGTPPSHDSDAVTTSLEEKAQEPSAGIEQESLEAVPEQIAANASQTEATENSVTNSENDVAPEGSSDTAIEQFLSQPVETLKFETEIVVEEEDSSQLGEVLENIGDETDAIIQHHLEDETLALNDSNTSDAVVDSSANNATSTLELLDILQGNDTTHSDAQTLVQTEAEIALQQLRNLKTKKVRVRRPVTKRKSRQSTSKSSPVKEKTNNKTEETTSIVEPEETDEKSIVGDLVKDWDDDEDGNAEKPNLLEETQQLLDSSNQLVVQQEVVVTASNETEEINENSTVEPHQDSKIDSGTDENQPHRRLGRVIKKKVIFDPDNPDTFTKTKVTPKNKQSTPDKDTPPSKKGKSEAAHPKEKSKSPISKMQWKKPTPKTNKNTKRLTEVDKLLMDEGAVNMIYQLTPEADKGRKNMRTKAEFIKKINQSSTPVAKEMKFRERKKDVKAEEHEAKKLGGKQRSSLSGSVKSMTMAEDFDAHCADDSIIYRRHSSSSYSSSCMSPRRLSDVEGIPNDIKSETEKPEAETSAENLNVFLAETVEQMNKTDVCLTLKQKLNSKLSNVLNKRKRESSKTDKVSKKKVAKLLAVVENTYKNFTVTLEDGVANIHFNNTDPSKLYDLQTLQELEHILTNVDAKEDVCVTLLTSEHAALCKGLDLRELLEENLEKRTNAGIQIAGSIRSLLSALQSHRHLLVCGVSGPNFGLSLALVLMCDVTFASEGATFAASGNTDEPIAPGLSVLTSGYKALPRSLCTELLIFGRRLSANEAQQHGIVNRVLMPHRFLEEVRAHVHNIASQSSLHMKKRLLNSNATPKSIAEFHECLSSEQDLLVQYWTSMKGQETLRALYDVGEATQ